MPPAFRRRRTGSRRWKNERMATWHSCVEPYGPMARTTDLLRNGAPG
jgi:hypothetical protein